MQHVITKAQLLAKNACDAIYASPEWDAEQEALVYPDWEATVARLAGSRHGIDRLGWLVARELVPMTRSEFAKVRREARLAQREPVEEEQEQSEVANVEEEQEQGEIANAQESL